MKLLAIFLISFSLYSVSIGSPNGGHHHHDHDHDHGHGHGHGEHGGHGEHDDGDGEDCKDEVVLGDLIKELGIKVLGKDQESADDISPEEDHGQINVKALISELFSPSTEAPPISTSPRIVTSTQSLPIKNHWEGWFLSPVDLVMNNQILEPVYDQVVGGTTEKPVYLTETQYYLQRNEHDLQNFGPLPQNLQSRESKQVDLHSDLDLDQLIDKPVIPVVDTRWANYHLVNKGQRKARNHVDHSDNDNDDHDHHHDNDHEKDQLNFKSATEPPFLKKLKEKKRLLASLRLLIPPSHEAHAQLDGIQQDLHQQQQPGGQSVQQRIQQQQQQHLLQHQQLQQRHQEREHRQHLKNQENVIELLPASETRLGDGVEELIAEVFRTNQEDTLSHTQRLIQQNAINQHKNKQQQQRKLQQQQRKQKQQRQQKQQSLRQQQRPTLQPRHQQQQQQKQQPRTPLSNLIEPPHINFQTEVRQGFSDLKGSRANPNSRPRGKPSKSNPKQGAFAVKKTDSRISDNVISSPRTQKSLEPQKKSVKPPLGKSAKPVSRIPVPVVTRGSRTSAASFNCGAHKPGLHTDPTSGCRKFIMCHENGRMGTFSCPAGTLFNEVHQVCDWKFRVKCL